jgi:protein TonB
VGEGDPGPLVIDDDVVEVLPPKEPVDFAEVPAEFVTAVQPEYPRFAEAAGIEGDVWIKALVSEKGEVTVAVVLRSSGSEALDEAARDAAFQNVFKPALQNGQPVAIWVTYRVEFQLGD